MNNVGVIATSSSVATARNGAPWPRSWRMGGAERRSPSSVIGSAQLVLGASGIVSLGIAMLFAPALSLAALAALGQRGVFAALTCLAGLWIADGRRRGAILAIVCDVAQVLALVLTAQWGITRALAIILIAATAWLVPRLERSAR